MANYYRPFTWLQRVLTTDPDTNQDVESFNEKGTLFGDITEMSAGKRIAFGILDAETACEIKFRQFPALKATDRLIDLQFDELLVIDGISKNHRKNETTVTARKVTVKGDV